MTVHTRQCAACGATAARVEVVVPGAQPRALADWPASRQSLYALLARPDQWRLVVDSVEGSNGPAGEELTETEAHAVIGLLDSGETARIVGRFPDRLGQCLACDKAYCASCWGGNVHGRCPNGHPGAVAGNLGELSSVVDAPSDTAEERPVVGAVLAEVHRAHLAVQEAEHELRLAVRLALRDGASWQTIAASIDSSEHAARERFAYLVPGALGTEDLVEEFR